MFEVDQRFSELRVQTKTPIELYYRLKKRFTVAALASHVGQGKQALAHAF